MSFVQSLARKGGQATQKAILTWPNAAPPITLTSGATEWTFGNWIQIIAVDTIITDYAVLSVSVSGFDTGNALDYQLELGVGDSPDEEARRAIPFHHNANVGEGLHHIEFVIPIEVSANTRFAARLACSSVASAKTIKLAVTTVPLPL